MRLHPVCRQPSLRDSDETTPSEPAHRYHPPEDLFDALSLALTDGVAHMTRSAPIRSRGLPTLDPGDVRFKS